MQSELSGYMSSKTIMSDSQTVLDSFLCGKRFFLDTTTVSKDQSCPGDETRLVALSTVAGNGLDDIRCKRRNIAYILFIHELLTYNPFSKAQTFDLSDFRRIGSSLSIGHTV